MRIPTNAKLFLGRNRTFPIEKIHYKTQQVTLRESEKVYNTVSIKNVEFDFSDFTDAEIMDFQRLFAC